MDGLIVKVIGKLNDKTAEKTERDLIIRRLRTKIIPCIIFGYDLIETYYLGSAYQLCIILKVYCIYCIVHNIAACRAICKGGGGCG